MKCPICNEEFTEQANLKYKTIFLCEKDGLFELTENGLSPMSYPCPKCGKYFLPYKHENGYAYMKCPVHGEFRTSIRVSFNFRKFCSEVASKPNRDPSYYTPGENTIRRKLVAKGLIENKDFFHNYRILATNNGQKHYYWLDFYLPSFGVAIEYSPSVWHCLWNRRASDNLKYSLLSKMGIQVYELTEKNKREWDQIIDRILGENRNEV